MKKDSIIKTLINHQYPERQAISVASELVLIDMQLVPMLEKWVCDGSETDVTIEDFSLMALKNKYEMTYPAALLTMDWLIKDPKGAKDCIIRGLR